MTSRFQSSLRWLAIGCSIIVCAFLTAVKLSVSSDMAGLFPRGGSAAALNRYSRAFGGHDAALVLIRGERPEDVADAATLLAEKLRHAPSIARVLDRSPDASAAVADFDPTRAWAFAGPMARERMAGFLSPDGMRARLAETRALLLAPAADDAFVEWISRDPLRLSVVPWETRAEIVGGVAATPGGPLVADEGRARLVVAEARGSAFVSTEAHAVVADVEAAMASASRPGVSMELAGGHAIAIATEAMLKRDLAVSGTLSMLLAALAFVVTFRRMRALVAVLPPLVVGTLWTTGIAAFLPSGLSAVAIAFAAVVVGVGVDTGVHVYSALLDARRLGYAGMQAADFARSTTWRTTLMAAIVAAVAFGSLSLSGLRAMQELGLLCGAGEVLTAVAILLLTPDLGAWLERGRPPSTRPPRWVGTIARLTSTRRGAAWALVACASPLALVSILGWPHPADALVAVRPHELKPLAVEERIRALFGGSARQWVVLTADPDEEHARARADRIAEALELLALSGAVGGFESLTAFAPSRTTQQRRFAERDALHLPELAPQLEASLKAAGFDLAAFGPAVDAFRHPAAESTPDPMAASEVASESRLASGSAPALGVAPDSTAAQAALPWLVSRHVAREGADTLVSTYVRPGGDPGRDAEVRAAISAADPQSVVTGFSAIDDALREALGRDMVLVGGAAFVLVAIAMRVALRSARFALIALATLACEMGVVGVAMRVLSVRWHIYDALVLPVLFGVTVDESMFLLHAAREGSVRRALEAQGPLVAATALTTAAGFVALTACRFDGLRDLGEVGAIGVLAGLAAALVVVPAALRLLHPAASAPVPAGET